MAEAVRVVAARSEAASVTRRADFAQYARFCIDAPESGTSSGTWRGAANCSPKSLIQSKGQGHMI